MTAIAIEPPPLLVLFIISRHLSVVHITKKPGHSLRVPGFLKEKP